MLLVEKRERKRERDKEKRMQELSVKNLTDSSKKYVCLK